MIVEGPQVQNYFAEQPSGRNLLHVNNPAGARPGLTDADHAAAAAEAAARVLPPARTLGTYQEQPSGRSLMRSHEGVSVAQRGEAGVEAPGHGKSGDYSEEMSVSESEGSSRWEEDSAAQSYPQRSSYEPSRASSGFGPVGEGEGGGEGATHSSAVSHVQETYVSGSSGSAMKEGDSLLDGANSAGPGGGNGGDAAGVASAAASRLSGSGLGSDPGLPPRGGQPVLQLVNSSSSSDVSRVQAPYSVTRNQSHPIIGQGSWRSSGTTEGDEGMLAQADSDRYLNSEAASGFESQMGPEQQSPVGGLPRPPNRGESQGEGDYGSVWLANRAHARQFDPNMRGSL